jgi:hypothetical protein
VKAHNIVIICMGALLLSAATVFADTIPEGDVSGTWYAANSPYYITGSITIPTDSTLTIEPGVDVIFLGNYQFTILHGCLEAVGTPTDSIRFFPQDTVTGWIGMQITTQDTCHLTNCVVEYANSSGIRLYASQNVYISRSTIAHCWATRGGGITVNVNSSLRLFHSTIEHNTAVQADGGKGGGICVLWSDTVLIDSCIINDNHALVTTYDTLMPEGGGIYIAPQGNVGAVIRNCEVTNNIVGHTDSVFAYHARGAGMYISSDSVVIADCVIRNNIAWGLDWTYWGQVGGAGIFLHDFPPGGQKVITDCDISYNRTRLMGAVNVYTRLPGSSSVTISNCTFFGNDSIIGLPASEHCAIVVSGVPNVEIINCIIANNERYGINTSGNTQCWYSNLYENACYGMPFGFGVLDTVNYNGDSCDVYFNIFLDPMFVDTANGDLHLLAGSPCIDGGDPAYPHDPDSTVADMGCYFFDQRMPSIALSTTTLDYGSVTVGQSVDLPFIIYNLGDGNLRISDISNNLAVFVHNWSSLDSIVPPGDSLEVMVTFTPDDTVAFNDTCRIDNNDTLCCVTLTGQGLPPGVAEGALAVPKAFALHQALPNPCQSFARLQFELPRTSVVSLSVYDVSGRMVSRLLDGLCEAGIHEVMIDASGLSAGVYFCRLKATGYTAIRKIIMTK